ncbi:MAG: glycosyltransferase family 2 protein [Leptolyngbyaceae cyanobacterium CSU_1_4]|nr:glycosyltransferase family 2 protein [Leptolyngbyaceae cyanobacterium CSU_1_4]
MVAPAYNEAAIIQSNLVDLCQYLEHLEDEYQWELILVNDGSRDHTGDLAEAFARSRDNVHVIHHVRNAGLGQALRSGFAQSRGAYIITLDLDLSYAPEHIEALLTKIRQTGAKLVVTSPYMKGGKVSNVPRLRLLLSIWANRFLSVAARHNVSTLTGMVRVYDAEFLQMLNLRSAGMDINPEVVHKAMLLGVKIEEIPAHLHWRNPPPIAQPVAKSARRKSSMKILSHIWVTFYYGFVFRPVMFFIVPSLFCFLLTLYSISWAVLHSWRNYQALTQSMPFPDPTEAIALAFKQSPHTFVISGMLLMVSIQLFSLGVLAVQNKRYFEEVFYLGTAIYRSTQRR